MKNHWVNFDKVEDVLKVEDGLIEYEDGTKMWIKGGDCHRLDGPAIEWSDGTKEWCVAGGWHRLDGPALEFSDGEKSWWKNGRRHRLDGPAVICSDGSEVWYRDGVKIDPPKTGNRMNDFPGEHDNHVQQLASGDDARYSSGIKVEMPPIMKPLMEVEVPPKAVGEAEWELDV